MHFHKHRSLNKKALCSQLFVLTIDRIDLDYFDRCTKVPLSIVKSVQSLVNLTNRKSNNKIYIKVPPVVQYRPPEYNPRDQESNLIWPGQGVRGSGQSREDQNPRDWNQRRGKFQEDGLSRSNFFNLKI